VTRKTGGFQRRRKLVMSSVFSLVLGTGVLIAPLHAAAHVDTDWEGCVNSIGGGNSCQIANLSTPTHLCLTESAVKQGAAIVLESCSGHPTDETWSIITPGYDCDGVEFGFDDVLMLVQNGVPCTFKPWCLSATAPGTTDGTLIVLEQCTSNNEYQEWLPNAPDNNEFENVAHGLMLDAAAQTDQKAGGKIQLWTNKDDLNQQWAPPGSI
jgi:hypothetical protein